MKLAKNQCLSPHPPPPPTHLTFFILILSQRFSTEEPFFPKAILMLCVCVCVCITNYQGLLVTFFRTGLMLAPGAHCASVYLEIPLKIVQDLILGSHSLYYSLVIFHTILVNYMLISRGKESIGRVREDFCVAYTNHCRF